LSLNTALRSLKLSPFELAGSGNYYPLDAKKLGKPFGVPSYHWDSELDGYGQHGILPPQQTRPTQQAPAANTPVDTVNVAITVKNLKNLIFIETSLNDRLF
jgi:hypothetical protein